MTPPTDRASPRAVIVGDNPETIENLSLYLNGAGLPSRATRRLAELSSTLRPTDAAVIFPDDFDRKRVLSLLAALQKGSPHLLIVLITSSPQSYSPPHLPGCTTPPLLLPKPTFGWTILDAIRESGRSGAELS